MARRRYQRGSLIREGDRWIARWREDIVLPSGEVKRIRKGVILGSIEELQTKKLAQRALDKRLESINHEEYRPASTITFAEFAKKWKKEIMIHHKRSSQSSEESIIDVHLVPFFGEDQVRNIKAEKIQRFVNDSEKSPKTVKNHVSLLMVMWDQVKAWEYAQHNPFPRKTNGKLMLIMPRVVKGKMYSFTLEETLAIIDKAEGRWKVFFRILAETGMRPGELAGLRTCDVGERTIRIVQSVWQQEVQTPKTDNAVRTFAISASLGEAIREVIAASEPNIFDLVFVTDEPRDTAEDTARVRELRSKGLSYSRIADLTGIPKTTCQRAVLRSAKRVAGNQPLSMDNFRQRVLNPILEELGILAKIKALGIRGGNYAFRHMNATAMDGLHTPLKTRQKRLGHADVTTTLTHYSHAVDADDLAAADALGALLSPKMEMEVVQ